MSTFQKYFARWAAKRAPRAAQVVLRHSTIYVLPSRQGLGFLLTVLLVWILGTNYQNNIILALSFFLLSVMLVSVIHAFRNLLGLTFTPKAVQYAAVGELAAFEINLNSRYQSPHHAIILSIDEGESDVKADLAVGQDTVIRLHMLARRRGWLKMPRIVVKSYYPFGFIRVWSYVELEHRALIFPQPIATDLPPLGLGEGDEGIRLSMQTGDEFQGFQTYQPGAPLSQIAWKQYARGAGLHLKDYRALQSKHYWLDFQMMDSRDTELALSQLTYWVIQFSADNCEFGLLLPGERLELGSGDVHRLNALTALALVGWTREESK